MKKVIIAILILILLAVTNPSKDDFSTWLKEKMQSSSENVLTKGVVSLFGSTIIENSTTSTDYILFSVYDFKLGGKKVKIIGILHNFIPVSSTEEPDSTGL